jgi:hypothetical protein
MVQKGHTSNLLSNQAMSDYYNIQEVGGSELARPYADRGIIPKATWHRAVLTAGKKVTGWRRWFQPSERFIAILSANSDGLRVLVSLDNFAVFIPWSELSASGERSAPGTVIRLQTAALPHVHLEFHLDDVAADELFAGVMLPLPQRDPPGRLLWPKPWVIAVLVSVAVAVGVLFHWLQLSGIALTLANLAAATAMALLWIACKPMLAERR